MYSVWKEVYALTTVFGCYAQPPIPCVYYARAACALQKLGVVHVEQQMRACFLTCFHTNEAKA